MIPTFIAIDVVAIKKRRIWKNEIPPSLLGMETPDSPLLPIFLFPRPIFK